MNTESKTWNPWPYAIIGYFVIFVSLVAIFIVWAVRQNMDLVRKDYYEEEMRHQAQMERVGRTQPVLREVSIASNPAEHSVTIRLPAAHAASDPRGRIHLYRPSNAKLDRELPLAMGADGVQILGTRGLEPGLWKVKVYWKAGGEEYFFDQSVTIAPKS